MDISWIPTDEDLTARAAEVEAHNLAQAEQARTENEAPGGIYGPPAPPAPVTVAEAMTTMLHLARKLDVSTGEPLELVDLADLAAKLADAVSAYAAVGSAQAVADQHAESAAVKQTDRMRAIAAASADTVLLARTRRVSAHARLAEAIVAYDPRH
jgi:hypothetical protein